ncbi:putative aldouronate transport system substrate-binding protein [Paenibacillus sp. 1_12]|uniref:extracellular solute-binding protein n=1 Tax=Paenibacillus sp. 1_12 TaxID=1566278 RepID=UPI0008EF7A3C|nr:extracellular solute-binding protein [Paenibacillus sp. 1_12]SFL77199.1 putative aldouronate transport system substrate-binding protein [Paenibacillus sp. 1_12]
MKNTKLKTAICMVAAIGMIIGCSNQSEPGANGKAAEPAKNPTIKVALGTRGIPYVEGSSNINEDKYVKKLRELSKTDLKLELIPHREFNQKLTLLLAGGDLPDILQHNGINTPEVAPAVNNGAFYELNDLLQKFGPNLLKRIPKESWDSSAISKNGKIYAIPSENYVRNSVVYVRKDWLEKLNIAVPKTIDEYVAMLKAFKEKDPNGNGKPDEIPFSGRQNFAFSDVFFGAYDVIPDGWKYENNQLVPNFIRPQMKQALELHRMMYKEQLMDNEIFVQQGKDWDAKIKGAARVGMWLHDPSYPDKWQSEVRQSEPKAELINIPSPTGPDGKGGSGLGSAIGNVWSIPKSNKNPEEAIKFLNWFYSDEAQKFLDYGLEGEDYTVENGKIKYKYATTVDDINKENMHLMFMRFVGPSYLANEEFMKGRKDSDLILNALKVANSEGRKNDGLGMELSPTMQTKPELGKNGLWMETAAKIITGKDPIDSFDKFVEDWKKRGGDQIIKDATDWYNSVNKK